jgi:hypothetical protein
MYYFLDCVGTVQHEEGTYHELDEESRIFTEQGMQILYLSTYHSQMHILEYEC